MDPPFPDAILETQGLAKSYGDRAALLGVSLTVEAGEIVGLVGPNGAGKTTLLSIVAGLRRPDAGTVRVAGIDSIVDPRGARAILGYAPQEIGLYPVLTVVENLELFAGLAGLRRAAARRRIEDAAAALSLPPLGRRIASLSTGERRRVHVAVALLSGPKLVLLDEPGADLDVEARGALIGLARSVAARGAAVCWATNHLTEVEELSATVALLHEGELIARGPLSEVVVAHGVAAVRLTFEGPPPTVQGTVRMDGSTATVRVDRDPAIELPRLLAGLGADAVRIRSVEIVRPSLESVFLSLTGRRYYPDPEEAKQREEVVRAL